VLKLRKTLKKRKGRRIGRRVGVPFSKYGAKRTVVDGITFASKAEARRYSELRLMQREGAIRDLELQVKYPLHAHGPDGKPWKVGNYIADFVYTRHSDNEQIVEDVKGFKTPLYNWKKKHVAAEYGIDIYEV
jgi:hypothetical protein